MTSGVKIKDKKNKKEKKEKGMCDIYESPNRIVRNNGLHAKGIKTAAYS